MPTYSGFIVLDGSFEAIADIKVSDLSSNVASKSSSKSFIFAALIFVLFRCTSVLSISYVSDFDSLIALGAHELACRRELLDSSLFLKTMMQRRLSSNPDDSCEVAVDISQSEVIDSRTFSLICDC